MSIASWFDFRPKIGGFAAELMQALVAGGVRGWSYDEPGVALRNGSQVMNLANAFQRYVRSPRSERKTVIAQCVDVALHLGRSVPSAWSDAERNIFPVLRSRYEFSSIAAEHRGEPDSLPDVITWDFCGDLHVRLAYDFGSGLKSIGPKELEAWNLPADAVLDCAMRNLSALPAPHWQPIGADVYQLVSPATFEESMMLSGSIIDLLPFGDDAVLVACNRGGLLAADSNSRSSVAAMLIEAQRRITERPWPLSSTLCTRIEGRWREFAGSGEVSALQRSLHAISMAQVYADQKVSLERWFERAGHDVYVASCGLIEHGGVVESWCTWIEGIRSLLPRTDLIAFSRRDGDDSKTTLVAWADVANIVERYLQRSEDDPQRFFVNRFPSKEEWSVICSFERPPNT